MLQRVFWAIVCIGVVLYILIIPGSIEGLLSLLFIGKIPFTHLIIPPAVMFCIEGFLIVIGLVTLLRLTGKALHNQTIVLDKPAAKAASTPPVSASHTRRTRTKQRRHYQTAVPLQ